MTLKFLLDVTTFLFGWTALLIIFMLCVALFIGVFKSLIDAFVKEDEPKEEVTQPLLGVVEPNKEDKSMYMNMDDFHKMMKDD